MTGTDGPAIWFPTLRAGTGADVFTVRLVKGLLQRGFRAEITWLPHRAEYVPWTVPVPAPPEWATVAHVNTWLPPRFLPRNLPVVATIHHSMHHPDVRQYKGFVRAAYHRLRIAPNERRVLRRADRVVAVSHFVAGTTKRYLLDVPMDVIYNGVDTDKFRPGNRQHRSGEPFRLLYVGGWKKLKGVDVLASIMRELGESFELRYTGGAAAAVDKKGMPHNMHDIGRLQGEETVIAAMQDADAFLFPSRSEGLPLVVIEAMACGLPVIAAGGSSLVEVVKDEVTGFLCRQDDAVSFATAARCIAADTLRRQSMANAGRTRAISHFSEKGVIDSYGSVYRGLAGT